MIEELLAELDLDTKARILAGRDMWSLPAVPEIGLEPLVFSDGPIGVRGTEWSTRDPSIALPSPTAMAATWDTELVRRAGGLLAQEARRKGVHVLLAPTVNLHRTPLGGRHFECFSEDPLLTGEIGAAYVTGVQEGGVGVTVKHFVANDSETDRMSVDVLVGERALRELYLAPFEHIVRGAAPYGIMAAYNAVNGSAMCEHDELQNGVLRGEWGFDGFIVSDWFAARDTVRAALSGLDVAMPGPAAVYGEALARAVRDGKVPEEVVDEHVRRVLTLAARTGALGGPARVRTAPLDGRADGPVNGRADGPVNGRADGPVNGRADGPALARELAVRSTVLLRNDGVLPLSGRIALIGGLAKDARVMGGGSAQVFPDHVVSPLEGLLAAGAEVTYARGADPSGRFLPAAAGFELTAVARDADGEALAEFPLHEGSVLWIGQLPAGLDGARARSVEITGHFTPPVSGTHRFGIEGTGAHRLTVGGEVLFDGEVPLPAGTDLFAAFFSPPQHEVALELEAGRRVPVSLVHTDPPGLGAGPFAAVAFALGHRDPEAARDPGTLMEEAVRAAAEADVAVVVVGTSKEVESEGFDRDSLRLPGRQDELVSRVAAANPRTVVVVNAGAPVEMPWRDEVAAILLTWFPGQEGGHALADVLLGGQEPGGRLPTTWPVALEDCPVVRVAPADGALPYSEGVFIGYRAWERSGAAPAFEFGSGQGYTTWAYESARLEGDRVRVRVRNTGERPGREVVQVYLRPAEEDPERPVRWLAGFAVAEAAPGESAEVVVEIPARAYERWTGQGWRRAPGEHVVEVSHSLTDTRLVAG
ncbi:glycoside hydrolase family 3 C-terminal domain-containing protein [Planomonospora corallina]|uniref:Glycoside hydrolase family 3 C-terminal domain-containing protein n=1 Tax=Planomonospora corallina TaxID=1806052 RepID=A0ABV8I9F0_9ACTN